MLHRPSDMRISYTALRGVMMTGFNVNCKDCFYCHQYFVIDPDNRDKTLDVVSYCCVLGFKKKILIKDIEQNIDCIQFQKDGVF